jgi:uncharacterized membrane protein YdjX (TVP38/TMEM64 family)
VSYEVLALVAGLVIGSVVVYAVFHSLFRETYEAKLREWKATELAQAIE